MAGEAEVAAMTAKEKAFVAVLRALPRLRNRAWRALELRGDASLRGVNLWTGASSFRGRNR